MLPLKTGEALLSGPSAFVLGFSSSEIRSGAGFVISSLGNLRFFKSPDYSGPDGGFYFVDHLSK
ncbi:MAG: hypothetical protein ACYCT9_09420 [Leptospirillum sp.]|jgi:hypothetical protein